MARSCAACYIMDMIRTFAMALALSTSFTVLIGPAAYAQTTQAPDTDRTDQSEEDWRKSQKKKSGNDTIEDIFKNKSIFGSGAGQGYEPSPMESLPENSRRHLKKQRAKVIATSDPHNIPDAAYEPSEAAKSDPELAAQEKTVWDGMVKDMQTGGSGQPGQAGTGQGSQGQSPQGQSGQGQSQPGQSGQSQSRNKPGPVRGGSSTSVADILGKIKGMKSVKGSLPKGMPTGIPKGIPGAKNPFGTSPSGKSKKGTRSKGEGKKGKSPTGEGQTSGQAPAGNEGENKSASGSESQNDAQNTQAQTPAQNSGAQQTAAQTANNTAKANQTQSNPSTNAQTSPPSTGPLSQTDSSRPARDVLGPLERMKQEREASTTGRQSSAYDFLKDAQKPE